MFKISVDTEAYLLVWIADVLGYFMLKMQKIPKIKSLKWEFFWCTLVISNFDIKYSIPEKTLLIFFQIKPLKVLQRVSFWMAGFLKVC